MKLSKLKLSMGLISLFIMIFIFSNTILSNNVYAGLNAKSLIPDIKKLWQSVKDNNWISDTSNVEISADIEVNGNGQVTNINITTSAEGKDVLTSLSQSMINQISAQGFFKMFSNVNKYRASLKLTKSTTTFTLTCYTDSNKSANEIKDTLNGMIMLSKMMINKKSKYAKASLLILKNTRVTKQDTKAVVTITLSHDSTSELIQSYL